MQFNDIQHDVVYILIQLLIYVKVFGHAIILKY